MQVCRQNPIAENYCTECECRTLHEFFFNKKEHVRKAKCLSCWNVVKKGWNE